MRSKDFEQQARYIKSEVKSRRSSFLKFFIAINIAIVIGGYKTGKKCKKCFNIYPKTFDPSNPGLIKQSTNRV